MSHPFFAAPLIHYQLNAGERTERPRWDVTPSALFSLRMIPRHGGPIPGVDGYSVQFTFKEGGAMFVVREEITQLRISWCCVPWLVDESAYTWRHITQFAARHALLDPPPPKRPPRMPWVAELAMPAMLIFQDRDLTWLHSFESCMAWTILENEIGEFAGWRC